MKIGVPKRMLAVACAQRHENRNGKMKSLLLFCFLLVMGLLMAANGYAQTTYTWSGGVSGSWGSSINWTPLRTSPASTDILVFNTGGSITCNDPTDLQTIGGLQVSNNTTVTLTNTVGARSISIGNSVAGADLSVAAGSQLNVATTLTTAALTINLLTGATGSISGSMTFSSTGGNSAHQLLAADASSITFNNGSSLTQTVNSSGNIFGSSGTASVVIFASGSTFNQGGGSNPFGLTAPNAKVVFQTGSLYKVTGASLSPAFSGRTYANVEFAGSGTSSVSGGSAVVMDNLTITSGTVNIGMTGTPGHAIKGNISVASGATLNFSPGSAGTLNLNGTAAQTITNSGTFSTNTNQSIIVSNTTGVTVNSAITLAGTLTVNSGALLATGANLTTNGAVNMNGRFSINQGGFAGGTGTWTYNASTGKLIFNNSSGIYAVNSGHIYWPATNGPTDVNVSGAGGISLNVARTVATLFQASAEVQNANNFTFNGTCQINGGGFFSSGSPTYGASSTLVYNTTSYNVTSNEFPNTGVNNVTLTSPGGTNTVILDADKTISGALSVGSHTLNGGKSISANTISVSTGSLILGNISTSTSFTASGSANISLSGNWNVTGFSKGTSLVTFTNSGSINTATSFYSVTNSGGTRTINANIDIERNFNVTGGDVRSSGAKSLTMSGSTSTINITSGSVTGTDAGLGNDLSLIISGAQTTHGGSATVNADNEKKFFNITVNSGSKLILSRGILCKYGTFTVDGTIQINANGLVNTDPSHGGNHRVPAYNASTGSLIYNNGGSITTNGEWPAASGPANVSLIAAGTNVTLSGNRTVGVSLTLTDGVISTGANILTVSNASAGAVTNTNGYVNGNLQRAIAAGSNIYAFPVGANGSYTPATLNLSGVAGAGNILVNSVTGASSNYPVSGLSTSARLARYWNITGSGLGSFSANIQFSYQGADLAGGAVSSSIKPYVFDAPSTYSYPAYSTGANTFTVNNITAFSEFGAGECDGPVAGITNNSGTTLLTCLQTSISVTATGGGTYSWSGGLGTNANASITSPGNYTVTVTAGNGCTNTSSVNITQNTTEPSASITSGNTSICNGGSTLLSGSVTANGNWSLTLSNGGGTITGTGSGTWNATVSPASTTTYTITSLTDQICTASGGNMTGSAEITVLPNASVGSITGANPVCIGQGETYVANSVVLGGGTSAWNSDNPLVATINPSGTINPVASGTTNISFTITGGCGGTVTSNLVVTVSPNASVGSVSGSSPICIGSSTFYSANLVVLSGGTGSWSSTSPAVADVNPSTGEVTAYSSGNTNIIYTITGGCGGTVSASAPLTVSPDATAGTISGAASLCISTNAGFSSNGDAGGSWSSSNNAVATVHPVTGLVSAVAPGTATITYTVSSGCNVPVSATKDVDVINGGAPAVSGLTNVCPFIGNNTQVTYTASAPGATGYTWTVPANVNIISGQGTANLTVTFNAPFQTQANKQLRVRAISACGTSAQTIYYLLAQAPGTPLPITASGTDVCPSLGTNVPITYTIPKVIGAASYIWTGQAGTTNIVHPNPPGPNDTTVIVTFGNSFTTSNITVQAVNSCGVSGTRSITVTRANPATPGLISGPTNVCAYRAPLGTAATYSVAVQPTVTQYNWTLPPGALNVTYSGATNNQVSFIYPIGYSGGSISVVAVNGCGVSTTPRSLAVATLSPATASVIDVINTVTCADPGPDRVYTYSLSGMPANATYVLWTVPPAGTIQSGQGSSSITVSYPSSSVAGTVTATAQNNCGSSATRTLEVKLPTCPPEFAKGNPADKTGLPVNGEKSFSARAFPNPSSGDFRISLETTDFLSPVLIRVLDLTGTEVYRKMATPANLVIPGNSLKPGVYMLDLLQGQKRFNMKVLRL